MLNPEQLAQYARDGFLIINDFASTDECRALRERASVLVENSGMITDPRAACNSKNARYSSYSYFEESTNKASLFFDSSAVAPDGTFIKDKHQSIIKIGHALHDCDQVFEAYSHSRRMHEILSDLGYKKPLIGQSRFYFRLPGINTELSAHQDSTILYTEPASCLAIWLALEEADIQNGCMWVRPGSHKAGVRSRRIKGLDYGAGEFRILCELELPDDAPFIALEVKEGAAVLMSGELIHKSGLNNSTRSRKAYTLHFIEGAESHRYPEDNWLQRPGGFQELRSFKP